MRLPSFQAPFQGKSGISHGNPRTNSGGGKGDGGRRRERKPRCIAVCLSGGVPGSRGCQLSLVWFAVACAAPAGRPRMAASLPQGASLSSPLWLPVLSRQPAHLPPALAGVGACPSLLLSPGGQLPGALAAGLQVSLPPATRRKLFELARAFSEKTKMRKSKRKHLLKHQSYPFWPGTGWGQWVLGALRPWAGLPKAIPSSRSGTWVCGPPFSMSPAANLLSHLSVPVLTTMTRLGEKASV